MAEQPPHHDRVEFETPPYGGSFIFQMVLLAFATLGLQIGLFWLASEGWQSNGQPNGAMVRSPLGLLPAVTVMPGSTVVYQEEVWVSVVSGPPPVPGGATTLRAASSRLIAFDLKTGKPRETGITLSPSPAGLLIIEDQLWCVAETVVYRIQNGEALPRHPRRVLIEPSKPFVHDGRLAIIDKNKNNNSSLLTWNDGEWTDEGLVDVPVPTSVSPWFPSELRVVSNGQSTFVFLTEGQNILYREGFDLISASEPEPEPASALEPENATNLRIAQRAMSMTPGQTPGMTVGTNRLPGWKTTPISRNWGTTWEVALINDELWAFSHRGPYNDNAIQQFKFQGGTWVNTTPNFPPEMRGFGVAGGSSGYLVTDDWRLFSLIGSTFQRVTIGFPMSERLRTVLNGLGRLACYLLANGVLMVGTWWLMRVYRKPEYLYGKRTVIQASIVRRGFARGIDLCLTVFPAVFWFSMLLNNEVELLLQQQSAQFGIPNLNLNAVVFFSIFGMWLGVTLVLCYMEGYWGFTPGKWLLGIRTLRTTLRPCGMLRAFARELLLYADCIFFLTWLPGVLLISFTPHWQRLGDLTADTVVVLNPVFAFPIFPTENVIDENSPALFQIRDRC